MRPKPLPEAEAGRVKSGPMASKPEDGNNGAFWIKYRNHKIFVIASDGAGWDHVSASLAGRCPTWREMCHIKTLFWSEEETVVQFHPKKSEYVNRHPFTLHLWKNQAFDYQLPMFFLIGPKI